MSRAAVQNQSYMGHPPAMRHPAGGGRGGPEDGKPSRLLQMREDYQRRMMKEKEERMINNYEVGG